MARTFRSLSAGVLAMVLVVAGCGDDGGGGSSENLGSGQSTTSSSAAGGASGTDCRLEGASTEAPTQQVVLTLNEFSIKGPAETKGGIVTFVAENAGQEPHELVIVKGESAEALPKDADGALDEEKLPEGALIGEIEPFNGGQLCKGAFNLSAGKYVLLCNIVEEEGGVKESHVKEGMHAPITVT